MKGWFFLPRTVYPMPADGSTLHTGDFSPGMRTWAELDLGALRHNVGVARRYAWEGGEILAVVKADAYGHGAALMAPALEAAGVERFAVATVEEALELRHAGVTRPVYLLGPCLPSERELVVEHRFIPAVASVAEAEAFAAARLGLCGETGRQDGDSTGPQPVHLVIDTGMGRIGVLEADAVKVALGVSVLTGVTIDSVASHFPDADRDEAFTRDQLGRYQGLLAALREAGVTFDRHHVANTPGSFSLPRSQREMIRVGLMLCGVSPLAEFQHELRPVLTWQARVIQVRTLPVGHGVSYGRTYVTAKPTRVATLAVGYADGYPRHLSGKKAWVALAGQQCPVLGRVTMDQMMVEAPESVQPGDAATLLGGDGPSVTELAALAETIPYEIFTRLGRRVRRILHA
jgi:alanine racemase